MKLKLKSLAKFCHFTVFVSCINCHFDKFSGMVLLLFLPISLFFLCFSDCHFCCCFGWGWGWGATTPSQVYVLWIFSYKRASGTVDTSAFSKWISVLNSASVFLVLLCYVITTQWHNGGGDAPDAAQRENQPTDWEKRGIVKKRTWRRGKERKGKEEKEG